MRALCILLLSCSSRVVVDDDAGPTHDAARDIANEACAMGWPDRDGDTFGDALAAAMVCGGVANKLDCGDGDARMHPGQSMPQRGPAMGMTSGSAYDYDCDGKDTIANGNLVAACSLQSMCTAVDGWWVAMGQPMITSCAMQYDWKRCDKVACLEYPEKRYPDCL